MYSIWSTANGFINTTDSADSAIANINALADLYKGTKFYAVDSFGRMFAESIVMCKHLNMREIGMVGHYGDSKDCGYGCKIMQCEKCGETFESHRSIYGCKL
jgi:hypothetical protein